MRSERALPQAWSKSTVFMQQYSQNHFHVSLCAYVCMSCRTCADGVCGACTQGALELCARP